MTNKQIVILLSAVIVVIIAVSINLTVRWQGTIEQHVQQIKRHVQRQDSVITRQDSLILDMHEDNEKMRANIRHSDSVRLAQRDTIQMYAKEIDSIHIIIRYLERANLR